MSKTALLFAGQGAQAVGMGKELAEAVPEIFEKLSAAAEPLGFDLASICFDGPEDELTKTEYAQPGIFFVSWLAYEALKSRVPDLAFDATAGLSLGEFTALAAAGAMSFEDGLGLVRQRGRFMQEACDVTQGGMAAIIGLDVEKTRAVCEKHGVELANLNCPGQLVISGAADKIQEACDSAKEAGAKRALPLTVAGAYHSPLMDSACPKLKAALEEIEVSEPAIPVVSNVTAAVHGSPESIRETLVQQVTSSVRWEESIRRLIAEGCTRFIELGPGKTLTNFMKRIDGSQTALNVQDVASLDATVAALNAA
jgi:[acyl-carrier-protein] S-malonyltransferase